MSVFYYQGVTAYIQEGNDTNAKLAVLAQAIRQLPVHPIRDASDHYATVVGTDAYKRLCAMSGMIVEEGDFSGLPLNTPEDYEKPQLERLTIKGQNLVRIYIPLASEDIDDLHTYAINSFVPVLDLLFGRDLVCVKGRFASMFDAFNGLPADEDEIIVPVNRDIAPISMKDIPPVEDVIIETEENPFAQEPVA